MHRAGLGLCRILGWVSLVVGLWLGSFGQAQAQSVGQWYMNEGSGIVNFTCQSDHGAVYTYQFASIPPWPGAGWTLAPDPVKINLNRRSTLCDAGTACRCGADFTYFRNEVTIPQNFNLTSFVVELNGMDDGTRITIYNSRYPNGVTPTNGYVFLGQSLSQDLKSYAAIGEVNVVVLTHVDDCCQESNLREGYIRLNGQRVPTCQPTAEICDGLDNDCDGKIDETFLNKGQTCNVGVGECARSGTYVCNAAKNGTQCSVQPGAPSAEICDGKDNDCNGLTDETFPTKGTACEVGVGSCKRAGQLTCNSNGSGLVCSAQAGNPQAERCDGVDNDCDGKIDEDFSNKGTACSVGVGACKNSGTWNCKSDGSGVACSGQAGAPQTERCDGIDNDCDGKTDEDFSTLGQSCSVGVGGCLKTANYTCKADGSGVECPVTAEPPTPEVCDGKDNDCNGQIDDGLVRACQSACGAGVETCAGGQWGKCSAREPSTETCNGVDDDCDGQVDNGVTRPCQNACGAGTETCVNGRWDACSAKQPKPEECNGVDDDCDGQIDNGLAPRECQAACGKGTATCQGGQWTGCSGPPPEVETCNGKDDDCDGVIDNGVTRPCQGKCGSGLETCHNGNWLACSAPTPQPEICDGRDDDCDGVADNNAVCPQGLQCKDGACVAACRGGECAKGQTCKDGVCIGADPCVGVSCAGAQRCLGGRCVDPCTLVQCSGSDVCNYGKCVPNDCYVNGCPSGSRCVGGVCEVDPCQGVNCAATEFCRDGKCVGSCAGVTCAQGEICVDGACKADPSTQGPCAGVTCAQGEVCVGGTCKGDPCASVSCPKGRACQNGLCEHDPCLNIACPNGQTCVAGQCVGGNGNGEPNNGEGGNTPDGGNNGEGGNTPEGQLPETSVDSTVDPEGNPVTENNVTPDIPGNVGDTGGTSEKKVTGTGSEDDTKEGRYQSPGCSCHAVGPSTSLWLVLCLLALVFLRRRRVEVPVRHSRNKERLD
ncbi:MAG: hypothetical protein H6728_15285 [Myxococcales bacterium]|nr:hypothetical protein [Myxococcales bacterium]